MGTAPQSLKPIRVGLAANHARERNVSYQRHRPEATALYELVRDNLETLYAIDDGALDVRSEV